MEGWRWEVGVEKVAGCKGGLQVNEREKEVVP
jgi:hypothetical protein